MINSIKSAVGLRNCVTGQDGLQKFIALIGLILLLSLIFNPTTLQAQQINSNVLNSLHRTNQAILFGEFGLPADPVTAVMPGTAYAAGFGTYLDNPASAALFGVSFGEFGLGTRFVNENAAYRSINRDYSNKDNQGNITQAGYVHFFPVDVGRFVAGVGYTQFAGYNRTISVRARNIFSSITDYFKWPGSIYSDIAFNTFATDYGDEFQDWDESIFRVGFENVGTFPGIGQTFTITERGFGGEYTAFAATEFRRNLMVGLSFGWIRGNYSYKRDFQEIDTQNVFNSDFIDTTGDGEPDTDIDRVRLEDNLIASFGGFRLRAGLLYRFTPFINAGISYTPATKIKVNEVLIADVSTTMKNSFVFEEGLERNFSYQFKTPSKTSLGLALDRYYGFTLSLAADYVDFTNSNLDYQDSDAHDMQERDNEIIEESIRSTWSLKVGGSYDITPRLALRSGFSHHPARFDVNQENKRVFSLGFGIIISPRFLIDMAFQNEQWDEVSSVYDFIQYDYSSLPESIPDYRVLSQNADRQVSRWSAVGSLLILL